VTSVLITVFSQTIMLTIKIVPNRIPFFAIFHFSGEKPHVCVYCGKAFRHLAEMKNHAFRHLGKMVQKSINFYKVTGLKDVFYGENAVLRRIRRLILKFFI
jgi:hypothetical protein